MRKICLAVVAASIMALTLAGKRLGPAGHGPGIWVWPHV